MSVAAAATGLPPTIAPDRVTVPVKWWAALGAGILAFQAFVLARWLTGPYFKHVDPGPTPLPGWMKVRPDVLPDRLAYRRNLFPILVCRAAMATRAAYWT